MKCFNIISFILLLSGCASNENAFLQIIHEIRESPYCMISYSVPYDVKDIKYLSKEDQLIFLENLERLFTRYPIKLSKEEVPSPKVIPEGLVSINCKDTTIFVYTNKNKKIYKIQCFKLDNNVLSWWASSNDSYNLP